MLAGVETESKHPTWFNHLIYDDKAIQGYGWELLFELDAAAELDALSFVCSHGAIAGWPVEYKRSHEEHRAHKETIIFPFHLRKEA